LRTILTMVIPTKFACKDCMLLWQTGLIKIIINKVSRCWCLRPVVNGANFQVGLQGACGRESINFGLGFMI